MARKVLFAVVSLALVAALAADLVSGGGHRRRSTVPSSTTPTTGSLAGQGLAEQTPETIAVSQSPVQVAADQQVAEMTADSPGLSQVAVMKVPAPAVSGGWPGLRVANDPETWATSFVAGLLDVDYATRSRAALGPWLMAEEAPEFLPGVPPAVEDKVLYAWLLDPGLVNGSGPPIPSVADWASDADAGARQIVSNLVTQADPTWQQLIDAGWQPRDVRTDVIDVSGLLTVTRGATKTVEHFTMAVATGSARWHAGYGTVEVQNWAVTP